MNENGETMLTLTIYSNYNNSKIPNLSNIKPNTIEISQIVFYVYPRFSTTSTMSSKYSHNLKTNIWNVQKQCAVHA